MDYLQILILACIQGAAELLPVSSSAHVIVAAKLMGLKPSSPEFVFLLVMLHTGTMFAVLAYFWPRWKQLLVARAPGDGKGSDGVTRGQFLMMIVIATACTAVIGLGLKVLIENIILMRLLHRDKAEVEDLFDSLPLVATALFLVGVFIIVAGLLRRPAATGPGSIRAAVWIGLVQGLCLPFRGFSRSGATISTGLCCGLARPWAEEFSFALAVVLTPPVIGRGLYRLLHGAQWPGEKGLLELLLPGLVGMVFSFAAGLLALKVLSAVLEKGRWHYFGYYCIVAALGVAGAAVFGF
jgi:undecaprenyl-diphosphatase